MPEALSTWNFEQKQKLQPKEASNSEINKADKEKKHAREIEKPKTLDKTKEGTRELNKTQINLMEMASCSEISATAYMIDVQPHRKCIAEECNKANWGSERKHIFLHI